MAFLYLAANMAKRFKVPTEVIIMGKIIPVTREPLRDAHAQYHRVKNSIIVDTGCPDDLLEASLLHECVHAALWTSGVSMMLTDDLEEAICFCMENLLSVVKIKP